MSMGYLKMVLNVLLKIHWVPCTELFNITVRNSNVFVVNKLATNGTQWNESFTETQSGLFKLFFREFVFLLAGSVERTRRSGPSFRAPQPRAEGVPRLDPPRPPVHHRGSPHEDLCF